MKVGDNIEFNYLKGYDCDLLKGILTKDYSSKAEAYSGKVVEKYSRPLGNMVRLRESAPEIL